MYVGKLTLQWAPQQFRHVLCVAWKLSLHGAAQQYTLKNITSTDEMLTKLHSRDETVKGDFKGGQEVMVAASDVRTNVTGREQRPKSGAYLRLEDEHVVGVGVGRREGWVGHGGRVVGREGALLRHVHA